MSSGYGGGFVDQWTMRMRVATFAAGIWLTYAVCATAAVYLALTWEEPHRAALAILFGAATVMTLAIARLPRARIVESRYREVFFFCWSVGDLSLIVLGTLADGGTKSPLALIFFVPVVFSAMSYPLGSVLAVGGLTVAAYLTIAVSGGGSWGYQAVFAAMLACTGAMSAWQARNHDRQRAALMDVSRTDPLTGCLNRRGFEERAVAEISAAGRGLRQGALLLLDLDHFKQVNDVHGHAAGDELLRWVVRTLGATIRPSDTIGRLGGDEFAVLFADIDPAAAGQSAARVSEVLRERAPCSVGLASFPLDGTELEELTRQADSRLYASRRGRPEQGRASGNERLSWAKTLAHAVDVRMDAEHDHSRAVAEHAVAIAKGLGWNDDRLGMLRIAAMLHDVGKVTVPDQILCKPDALTPEELAKIKKHSIDGAEIVALVEGLAVIVPWIRHSHERYDGSGYPEGLAGEAIPEASRIMLVADAFDAITSSRPYREASSVEFARAELERHAGTQFDPTCVAALLAELDAQAEAGTPLAVARTENAESPALGGVAEAA
jgi:diguanylate cyclase (GGDEF)-like protein